MQTAGIDWEQLTDREIAIYLAVELPISNGNSVAVVAASLGRSTRYVSALRAEFRAAVARQHEHAT